MNVFDSIDVVLARYRDRLSEETRRQLAESYMQTLRADADARRSKTACDIKRMAALQIAVKRLELQYSKINASTGSIPAVDEMIRTAKRDIQLISMRKNSQ